MKSFGYTRARSQEEAIAQVALAPATRRLLGGGLDLLDLMKEGVFSPETLVSLADLSELRAITPQADGSVIIGSRVTLAEVATSAIVSASWPALSRAAGKAATPQIRNRATVGGNLLQRPRCWYFRKQETGCLKKGGGTCPAVEGENRYLAILGGGPCYAVSASSPSIALTALGARLRIVGEDGPREVAISDLYVSPAADPTREHTLASTDLITGVWLPKPAAGTMTAYEKVRHKEAWDWAMAEAAVWMTVSGGRITESRVVLGAVAPMPWRATAAETLLAGQAPSVALFQAAAQAAVEGAAPLSGNAYKVPAAAFVVEEALRRAAGL